DPNGRPASADALLTELDALSTRPALTIAALRRPRPIAVLIVVAILAVGFVAWRASLPPGRGQVPRLASAARHTPPDSAMRLYQRGMAEQRRRTLEGVADALPVLDRAIAAA